MWPAEPVAYLGKTKRRTKLLRGVYAIYMNLTHDVLRTFHDAGDEKAWKTGARKLVTRVCVCLCVKEKREDTTVRRKE